MSSSELSKENTPGMGRISVIVPVYKVEPYLRRCLDSILSQSFRDFELILVDDGSPDACGAICDEYAGKDSRIHVIHQENGGLSAARNAGIDWVFASSDSQWLTFIDSDDWVHPDYLRILYGGVLQTGCKLSACLFAKTNGEPLPPVSDTAFHKEEAQDYCSDYSGGKIPAVSWAKLSHRSLFRSLRFPVGKLCEDEFITYRLVFEAGQIAVSPARLYAYYQNPQGIMRSPWTPRRMDALEAIYQIIQFAHRFGYDRLLCCEVLRFLDNSWYQISQAGFVHRCRIRRGMRQLLRLGKKWGCLQFSRKIQYLYEAAYPCRVFWWLINHL